MAHLFTYGSLMFDDVWKRLVRGEYRASKALLKGYARRCVKEDEYPVIFEANESVEGIVYHAISDEDMEILDTFEGEFYERRTLSVENEKLEIISVDAYVLKKAYFHIIEDKPWSAELFEKEGMACFLASYKGFSET